jgi:nucleoside 2-deoxyribosyltransferase
MKSVVVCGSKKYAKEIKAFCSKLTKAGVVVYEPNIYESTDEAETFGSERNTKAVFKGLTLEHFDWIRKSEVCFLFNKDDYVGVSVTMEMGYASALGKPIFALSDKTSDPCRDALIDKVVKTPNELIKLL